MDFLQKYGPWALITGASEGVGRAFAHELAARGLNLILTARKIDNLVVLSKEIEREHGVDTRLVSIDLSEPDAVDVLYVRCSDLEVGLLVSNAGMTPLLHYFENGLAEVRNNVRLNVMAHTDLARYFGEAMQGRRRGGMIFMSSIVGLQGTPYMSLFSASKAFLLNLAEALNYENVGKGVNVTAVAPGPVHSSLLKIQPESERIFKDYQLSVLEPHTVARGALHALERNKAVFIPGRITRLRYGLWQHYFHSRQSNVSRWGKLVQSYIKAVLPSPFAKSK